MFFLDCFTAEQAAQFMERVTPALQPAAAWLFADFVLPPRGYARLRARAWLTLLYTFFGWTTGIQTRRLPPSETLITTAGFRRVERREFQHGLIHSALFYR